MTLVLQTIKIKSNQLVTLSSKKLLAIYLYFKNKSCY